MPATFQAPVKMAASSGAVSAGSAVFLCLLGLLGSLGESPLFWVVFGGAVVVVAALSGGGDRGAGAEGGNPVAHFGFPAEFHLVNEEEGETAGIGERPQVCCEDGGGCGGLCAWCGVGTVAAAHPSSCGFFLRRNTPVQAPKSDNCFSVRAVGAAVERSKDRNFSGLSKNEVAWVCHRRAMRVLIHGLTATLMWSGFAGGVEPGQPRSTSCRRVRLRVLPQATRSPRAIRQDLASDMQLEDTSSGERRRYRGGNRCLSGLPRKKDVDLLYRLGDLCSSRFVDLALRGYGDAKRHIGLFGASQK